VSEYAGGIAGSAEAACNSRTSNQRIGFVRTGITSAGVYNRSLMFTVGQLPLGKNSLEVSIERVQEFPNLSHVRFSDWLGGGRIVAIIVDGLIHGM
jgi:hypothetical protein